MNSTIPQSVLEIYKKLETAGFTTYLVGGSVRNILLKKEVKDWDMTTSATPQEILKLFPDAFYDNSFGTVGIHCNLNKEETMGQIPNHSEENNFFAGDSSELRTQEKIHSQAIVENKQIVEVTTFRTEHSYSDSRHPDTVTWGKSIEEDLERRDFTMNAIAVKLNLDFPLLSGEGQGEVEPHPNLLLKGEGDHGIQGILVDPFEGRRDIENHIIRAVGDATKRFKEDALRLMRAVRFATQLSFIIEEATWKAMQEDAVLLGNISTERIRDELLKILASDFPYEGIMLLKNAGLLQYILPELLEGVGISQSRPGRHHVYDVFEHNLLSLKFSPSKDPIVRFATLIHDIGKPRVESTDENGLVIFYNHEVAGAKMAYEICERLHFSKKDRQRIVHLIRWHMFSVDEHVTDAGVRRFIRRVGTENVRDLLDVRVGDRLGSGIPEEKAESWRLKLFKERVEQQLQPAPFSIHDLAIDGNDIMKELAIKPGPKIGKLLQQLFEEVDEDLSLNTKDYLLKRLQEMEETP